MIKMKKYLILSFLFLLTLNPIFAKGSPDTTGQQSGQTDGQTANTPSNTSQVNSISTGNQNNPTVTLTRTNTIIPTKKHTVTPTVSQIKNQNQVQTQNQREEQELSIKAQENEQLNQTISTDITKVSDQVHELISTVGTKGGIGQEVKEIAQSQVKLQDEIKSTLQELKSRGIVSKFFLGSDKKLVKTMQQQMEQNHLMVKQLEELKLQTKNSGDLKQLQETIDLMTYQNTSLQEKIDREYKINGMFGWLLNLFQK